jgi:stalled ribosome rescue protein Dom34
MKTRHAAVWIDHDEAKIFHVHPETFDVSKVQAPHAHVRRHEATTHERNHPADEQRFFRDVVHALEGAEEILVVGPAQTKLELMKHVREHEKALAARVVGVEAVDHPTDGELVAHVRKYFRAADRMRPA